MIHFIKPEKGCTIFLASLTRRVVAIGLVIKQITVLSIIKVVVEHNKGSGCYRGKHSTNIHGRSLF